MTKTIIDIIIMIKVTFDMDGLTFKLEVVEPQPVVHRGDVDGDDDVDIDDVTLLISYLLGKGVTINFANSDMDGSQSISIDDITLLIDVLLGK